MARHGRRSGRLHRVAQPGALREQRIDFVAAEVARSAAVAPCAATMLKRVSAVVRPDDRGDRTGLHDGGARGAGGAPSVRPGTAGARRTPRSVVRNSCTMVADALVGEAEAAVARAVHRTATRTPARKPSARWCRVTNSCVIASSRALRSDTRHAAGVFLEAGQRGAIRRHGQDDRRARHQADEGQQQLDGKRHRSRQAKPASSRAWL